MTDQEISVIVPTYNSSWRKIQLTLLSCLRQENVKIEIIVADDHSIDNHFDRLELFFKKHGFSDYSMIPSDSNQGTCLNLYQGLKKARYPYVKGIAPGDLLHDRDTLSKWVAFMRQNNIRASFCRNVFYKPENDTLVPFSRTTKPAYLDCYYNTHYDYRLCRYFDVVMRDTLVGVNFLFERELFLHYLKMLINHGVKYCEDYLRWPMYWDGIGIRLYDEIGTWYEHDVDGISSSPRYKAWRERIMWDEDCANDILIERQSKSSFLKRLVLLYKIRKTHNRALKLLGRHILFPSSLYWFYIKKTHKSVSCATPDSAFVLSLLSEVEPDS